jgi:hypothetical protein
MTLADQMAFLPELVLARPVHTKTKPRKIGTTTGSMSDHVGILTIEG